ncbi:hypothetical protein ACQR16_00530 [Bradyrhizobium oligotrophicum]|uniref:hypothetical protein n=1 Tax=Bradyrhizobium oligotrophicum TaxID=44255 RepID=UPI003EBE7BBE
MTEQRIGAAGNTEVPAYLTLIKLGYEVDRRIPGNDELWIAKQGQLHLVGDSPCNCSASRCCIASGVPIGMRPTMRLKRSLLVSVPDCMSERRSSLMKIVFESDTLHQSQMGSITAVVYFDFGNGLKFPAEGWNDFVAVIASWWTRAFEKIVTQHDTEKFFFMDGPYWISAVPQGKDLRLICVEDRRGRGLSCEVVTGMDDMRRELAALARRVSEACLKAGIDSPDLNALRSTLPR